jgi:hypothetical protein
MRSLLPILASTCVAVAGGEVTSWWTCAALS